MRYLAAVRRDWRTPGAATDLAAARIVIFGLAAWFTAFGFDWPWFAGVPPVLRSPPPGTGWLAALPLTPTIVGWFQTALLLASLSAAAGWCTRASAVIVCLLGVVVWGLPQLIGKVDHYHHLLWFAIVLAASPCGDALSIDARARPTPAPAVAYARPLRIIWVLMGLIYLFPGLAKASMGPLWIAPTNLERHIHAALFEQGLVSIDLGTGALALGAIQTIAFEVGFLVLVLHPATRPIAVGWGLLFHNLTGLLMGIFFWPLQACYLTFLPWARWGGTSSTTSRARSPRATTMVGGVLIASVALAGVTGLDSWPIAVYPRFNYLAPATATRLAVQLSTPSGPLDTTTAQARVIARLKPWRWAALVRQIGAIDGAPERATIATALRDLLAREDSALVMATTITVIESTVSTDPGQRGAPPLSQDTWPPITVQR